MAVYALEYCHMMHNVFSYFFTNYWILCYRARGTIGFAQTLADQSNIRQLPLRTLLVQLELYKIPKHCFVQLRLTLRLIGKHD